MKYASSHSTTFHLVQLHSYLIGLPPHDTSVPHDGLTLLSHLLAHDPPQFNEFHEVPSQLQKHFLDPLFVTIFTTHTLLESQDKLDNSLILKDPHIVNFAKAWAWAFTAIQFSHTTAKAWDDKVLVFPSDHIKDSAELTVAFDHKAAELVAFWLILLLFQIATEEDAFVWLPFQITVW